MKENVAGPMMPFLDDRSWPLADEFDKRGFKVLCVADTGANQRLNEFKVGESYWAYPLGRKKGYLVWPEATTNTVCTPDEFTIYFRKL
jgi:hypothetical protein